MAGLTSPTGSANGNVIIHLILHKKSMHVFTHVRNFAFGRLINSRTVCFDESCFNYAPSLRYDITFSWTLYSGTPTEPDLALHFSAVKPIGTLVTMVVVSVNPYAKRMKNITVILVCTAFQQEFYFYFWCKQYRYQQDVQLSQRDRAAGCVSFGQNWKTEQGDNIYRTL